MIKLREKILQIAAEIGSLPLSRDMSRRITAAINDSMREIRGQLPDIDPYQDELWGLVREGTLSRITKGRKSRWHKRDFNSYIVAIKRVIDKEGGS